VLETSCEEKKAGLLPAEYRRGPQRPSEFEAITVRGRAFDGDRIPQQSHDIPAFDRKYDHGRLPHGGLGVREHLQKNT
jgi:hypothetical protein